MKIAIIYFTKNGKNTANRIKGLLLGKENSQEYREDSGNESGNGSGNGSSNESEKEPWEIQIFSKWREDFFYRKEALSAIVKRQFYTCDSLIFVGAVGIAVRSIAPFLEHKYKDPAVLVIDELGKYCIPILSGHVGGANELAERIAELFGGEMLPVVTTATDLSGKWAVDVFAKKNQLAITDSGKARDISGKVLAGQAVFLYVEEGISLNYQDDFKKMQEIFVTDQISEADVYVGIKKNKENENALRLVPKSLTLGIGCKKNTDSVKIEQAVRKTFSEAELSVESIGLLCSIDLKAEEIGILEFCKKYEIPSEFYSAEELNQVMGNFTESAFVKSITGVDNVCERAALLGAGEKGRLLIKKQALEGVTVAVAMKP